LFFYCGNNLIIVAKNVFGGIILVYSTLPKQEQDSLEGYECNCRQYYFDDLPGRAIYCDKHLLMWLFGIPHWIALLIGVAIVIIYTLIGGFYAVA
jgi:hypothetical protein